jgi:hypothetical protein
MDLKPPISAALAAFSVPATVQPPLPENAPFDTEVIWIAPFNADYPAAGGEIQRSEPRRILGIPRKTFESPFDITETTFPRGTIITAPEELGADAREWMVDGFDRILADEIRLIVIPNDDRP